LNNSAVNIQHLPTLEEIEQERQRRRIERELADTIKNADAIRARCKTLHGFVKEAWRVLEPKATFVDNWHIALICAHLEAVTWGKLLELGLSNRLLFNVPPGSMKSLLISVMWQAWEWGPCGMRSMRYLTTAYNEDPVKRDTRKTRDLILSEWYQSLWPEVYLKRTAELSFENSDTGTREGIPFNSLTGQRGDRLVIDDPHSVKTAESDAERNTTTQNFREGALNRLNDQKQSAIVVVMQRLHHQDLSGVILKLGLDFLHVMLPMEFDQKRRCKTPIGEDPRVWEGELLDPVRMPREELGKLQKGLTAYASAGQYQQRPTPREGGMFKRAWFDGKIINVAPEGTRWVRHWDLAATKSDTAARTCGVKLGVTPDGKYVVGHVVAVQDEGPVVRRLIKSTAATDGYDVMISLPQDPGQAGKVQKADMIGMLAGYNARAEPETGDKATRAEPFSAQCEGGNVYIVRGSWNDDYIDELCLFPGGSFKDRVDATSGAFARLAAPTGTAAVVETGYY
jgi:predicted phage terminase large subunit-like protein